MGKKKNFAAAVVCVMVMELAGCAGGNEQEPSASIPMEEVSTGNDNEVQNRTEDNMQQKETETQEAFSRNEEDMTQGQTDAELEEELKQYRQEREDAIQESNGLVEGGSPDESNYSFDLSKSYYISRFDTKEVTEAYAAARIYVTDSLGIEPDTKMVTYMCIDPRILNIYEDEDKGVAAGYDNNNIFVCEYCNEDGVWQYLILVREGKGSEWSVIHNGISYKE
ncbi:MAG: hypothetical protein HFI61_13645 [Lachnospiraceae bacterium]|nr:hypothetical protein [Lachnospiraceae bacterium]